MTLANNFTMTKVNGGLLVGLHGAHGVIHRSAPQGSRFRRPVAMKAGYQRLGQDVKESTIEFWHACSSKADASTKIDVLNTYPYQVVTVLHAQDTNLRCVVTGVDFTMSKACKGPLISGTTYATWRLEGTITLEYAP